MKKAFVKFFIIIVSACSLITVSCSPEACYEETNAFLKASFYLDETKAIKAPDSLTLYGITLPESRIYDKDDKVQPALFPLDPAADNCTFVIRINGTDDTIKFVYSSFPHLISKECGYTFYHNLDTFYYSKNEIDYIYRVNNGITTRNEENIRIFY